MSSSALKLCLVPREELSEYECDETAHYFTPMNTVFQEKVKKAIKTIEDNKGVAAIHLNVERADHLVQLFTAIGDNCTQIEHFEVSFVFGKISDNSLAKAIKGLNDKLKHFIINESKNKCEMYPPGSYRPVAFGNNSMIELFNKCPNLELLVLNTGSGVSGESLKHIPSKIKSLYLPATWLNEGDMKIVATGNAKNVEKFVMIASEEAQFKVICENMVNLKLLQLPTLQLQSADPIEYLANLKNLENIVIGLSRTCIDEQLLKVLPNLKHLKRVQFVLCGITDKSLSMFSKHCPDLQDIEIYNYNEAYVITDESVKSLSELKDLQTLCIPQAKISEKSVRELLSKCRKVKRLQIDGFNEDPQTVIAQLN